MSWTAIDGDTSWQDLAIAQEIADAYNLRAEVCGADPVNPTEDMTVYDFIKAVQDGIEAMATQWANKDDTVTGALTSFPGSFADSAALLTAAGLPSGWRSVSEGGSAPADWPTYATFGSYGPIASGDLAGPWLFLDLEAALDAMTRQFRTTFDAGLSSSAYGGPAAYPATPDLVPSAPDFSADSAGPTILVSRTKSGDDPYEQHCIYRYCPSAEVTGLGSASKTVRLIFYVIPSTSYYDFGLGFTPGEYNLWTSAPGVTEASKSVLIFSPITTWDDVVSYLPWSSVPTSGTVTRVIAFEFAYHWVIDYDF